MPHKKVNHSDSKVKNKKLFPVWKAILIIFVVFIILTSGLAGLIFYISIYKSARSDTPAEISVIKDASAQIDFSKQEGDNLFVNSSKDKSPLQIQLDTLHGAWAVSANVTNDVVDFATKTQDWGKQIVSSTDKKNWGNVGDGPAAFTINLSDKDASDSYDDSLVNIERFQSIGDYAIANKDTATMGWLAGHIHAEQIFLDALASSNVAEVNQPNVAYAATSYGDICYWGRGRVMVFSNRSQKGACLKKLTEGLKTPRTVAQNYFKTGPADAAKDWQESWNGIKGLGVPISTTGASVQNDQPQIPPTMKKFRDQCSSLGGTTPASAVMDRLPTSEPGQTCRYKGPSGGACWILQVNSGSHYAGGDSDCIKFGLMPASVTVNTPPANYGIDESTPAPAQTTTKPKTTTTPSVSVDTSTNSYPFDGSYSTTPSIPCSTPDSSTSLNSDIINFMSTFTVKENKITYSSWYYNGVANPPSSPTIDANGDVSSSYEDSSSGADEQTSYSAHFTASGSSVSVSGNLSGSWRFGTGPTTTCSGTFSGSRSGS